MLSFRLSSVFVVFIFVYCSCNNATDKNKNDGTAIQTKSSATNFAGTFLGLIPCADCPGIEATVVFHPDSSFSELMIYQERASSFKDSGQWSKEGQILKINYNNEKSTPRYFLVKSDTTIAWMDGDKKEIEGPLKEHYILKRIK